MKRIIIYTLFLTLLVALPAAAQTDYKALCNEHPEYYVTMGPECVNPVPYTLPGFVPINTRVQFGTPGGQVLTGRVTGYYWHLTARAYLYTVEQEGTANPVIGWIVWPVTVTVMTAAGFVVWVSIDL